MLEGPKLNRSRRIFRSLLACRHSWKCHWTPNWFFVIFLSRFLRHQRKRSSSQLFSRSRMSFGKVKSLAEKFSTKERAKHESDCLEKFSIGHVTKLHNVARWLCDYFRYDNLFIISCSLSYLFRCTIRSRWNRLIVKIVMVSAKHFMCNLLSSKAVLLPTKERKNCDDF